MRVRAGVRVRVRVRLHLHAALESARADTHVGEAVAVLGVEVGLQLEDEAREVLVLGSIVSCSSAISPEVKSRPSAPDSSTERATGVLGVNVTNRDVKECNKRGCFHVHGQAQGGATPGLIADVAEDEGLRGRLLEALDTQLQVRVHAACACPNPNPSRGVG